jgi:biopolymer transport protein ExbB
LQNRLRALLLYTVPRLERGLPTMAVLINIAPLLGLLGTVGGMIQTFSAITRFGTANPRLLAEGISVSLVTTQAGLMVALPCLLFQNMLIHRKNHIIDGLIADSETLIQIAHPRQESVDA